MAHTAAEPGWRSVRVARLKPDGQFTCALRRHMVRYDVFAQRVARLVAAGALAAGMVACAPGDEAATPAPAPTSTVGPQVADTEGEMPHDVAPPDMAADAESQESSPEPSATARPAWLGTRVLPLRPDGFGQVQRTPKILRNRRLESPQHLPDPDSAAFEANIRRVPDAVVKRSTWSRGCPVRRDQLRYVTLHFWGFDSRPHTGELLVHRSAAKDVVRVFRKLYRARFPIEEMRVVAAPELDAPPTGDGNNTTSFVCRPTRGSTAWSQHAYGLAVDVNPFHNPYVKGDLVLPELASAYVNRDWRRPGMIFARGPVVRAFDDIGWGWGGRWSRPLDTMHFSANGR